MQRQQRKMQWALPWLILVLAVPALAEVARGGEEGRHSLKYASRLRKSRRWPCVVTPVTAARQRTWPKSLHHARYSRSRGAVRSGVGNVVCVPRTRRSRCVVRPVTAPRALAHQSVRPLHRDLVGRPVQYRQRGVLCVRHQLKRRPSSCVAQRHCRGHIRNAGLGQSKADTPHPAW